MFRSWKDKVSLADMIVIALVLASVFVSAVATTHRADNNGVYIYKNDVILGVYPINQKNIIKIDTHNTVMIDNGKVKMLFADCPDKRCVRQGAGNRLPIICLPNHVVVEIRSANHEKIHIIR